MKGLYCQQNGGSGDVVKFLIQETNLPSCLKSHQVKVQVKACALSPVDTKILDDLKLSRDLIPVGREISGVVLQVGPKVTFFQPDDKVVGILPLDAELSGLCDVVLIHEHHLVPKPEKVGWVEAAGTIRDGLRAYTALHSLGRVATGHTLLVLDGATPFGMITIQVAHYHGVKVLATALSLQDQQLLEQLRPSVGAQEPVIARVIGVWDGKVDLVEACMEETGGLGVDIIIDSGVRLYEEEPTGQHMLPHKHDLISVLGVGGHWVTTECSLQLDPPDSHSLFLRGASLSFLNEEVWGASRSSQGKYLHILREVVEKLSTGTLRLQLDEPVPFYEATVSMEMVQARHVRKRLVVQL
ncbi:quinone oxidoreductase-like protein 1 isoform X1 [Scleropages formosus]|uniref:quinone oxidoreductase-like protein 1 isoform X1 n=1 Tax=Scleropages formosus TaxID=113540 RepID=UPI000878640F|nr:quinone oxidoreductase-like protein 1 isoform X1 [Scleropages formosus]XP_018614261.1 quinone oxidoreductase-like protein 1 isoform X1 [Scleropages formosus]